MPAGKRTRATRPDPQVRGHDDQAIDPAAHRLQHRIRRLALLGVQVGQKQQDSRGGSLAVHAAHDFRKEFTMEVGQHDSDRVGPRQAQAASAGMRDISEVAHRVADPGPRLFADIVEAVEARDTDATETWARRATSRIVAFGHGLPYRR